MVDREGECRIQVGERQVECQLRPTRTVAKESHPRPQGPADDQRGGRCGGQSEQQRDLRERGTVRIALDVQLQRERLGDEEPESDPPPGQSHRRIRQGHPQHVEVQRDRADDHRRGERDYSLLEGTRLQPGGCRRHTDPSTGRYIKISAADPSSKAFPGAG